MTMYRSGYELHEAVLRGEPPSEAELRAFIDAPKPVSGEGQHHDYKHADILVDRKKGGDVLREYAAAFANAEGGVLIVGIDDRTHAWAPVDDAKFGLGGVKEWAEKGLNGVASGFRLTYRATTVVLSAGGCVLLVAASRSQSLVPLFDGQRPTYWFRFGHENRAVPDFLISDLVLGRRRQPTLTVEPTDQCAFGYLTNTLHHELVVELSLDVTNDSLVTARDIRVGLVGPFFGEKKASPVSRALLEHIDLQTDPKRTDYPLRDLAGDWGSDPEKPEWSTTLRPFDTATVRLPTRVTGFGVAAFAVYAVPEGCEPQWFQVIVDPRGQHLFKGDRVPHRPLVERARRPVVAFDWKGKP
jgi:hypothetical protein